MKETGEQKQALVIDDDPDIRELLQALLESAGFAVDLQPDGIHAITLTKFYDVILLDMKMPVFDGGRLTDYWRLTDPAILDRVILLSGYSRFARAQQPSVFASVPKPIDLNELLRTIHRCLEQHLVSFRSNP